MHANDLHIFTDMHVTRHALEALLAGDVGLSGYEIPYLHPADLIAHSHHFSTVLVAEDHGRFHTRLSVISPSIDMDISAADGRRLDLHQQIPRANLRYLHLN